MSCKHKWVNHEFGYRCGLCGVNADETNSLQVVAELVVAQAERDKLKEENDELRSIEFDGVSIRISGERKMGVNCKEHFIIGEDIPLQVRCMKIEADYLLLKAENNRLRAKVEELEKELNVWRNNHGELANQIGEGNGLLFKENSKLKEDVSFLSAANDALRIEVELLKEGHVKDNNALWKEIRRLHDENKRLREAAALLLVTMDRYGKDMPITMAPAVKRLERALRLKQTEEGKCDE